MFTRCRLIRTVLILFSLCTGVLAQNDGTPAPSQRYGWRRVESIALVQMSGTWLLRNAENASAGAYHRTLTPNATLRLPFNAEGVRIGFRQRPEGGALRVDLDGQSLGVIHTHIDETFASTARSQAYFFAPGYHILDLIALIPDDHSEAVAIDYIEIFTGPPTPAATATMSPEPRIELQNVRLISAPPTVAPTLTPLPPMRITVAVVVGIDRNANDQLEPTEGVHDLSIRAVSAADNALLASAMTDRAGSARLQVEHDGEIVLLIPLLGEALSVRARGSSVQESWTVLLEAANVPGLIP